MKLYAFSTLVISTAFVGQVFAADVTTCDQESFVQVMKEAANAPDEKKELAAAELQMAQEKMDVDDQEACIGHLIKASEASVNE